MGKFVGHYTVLGSKNERCVMIRQNWRNWSVLEDVGMCWRVKKDCAFFWRSWSVLGRQLPLSVKKKETYWGWLGNNDEV